MSFPNRKIFFSLHIEFLISFLIYKINQTFKHNTQHPIQTSTNRVCAQLKFNQIQAPQKIPTNYHTEPIESWNSSTLASSPVQQPI